MLKNKVKGFSNEESLKTGWKSIIMVHRLTSMKCGCQFRVSCPLIEPTGFRLVDTGLEILKNGGLLLIEIVTMGPCQIGMKQAEMRIQWWCGPNATSLTKFYKAHLMLVYLSKITNLGSTICQVKIADCLPLKMNFWVFCDLMVEVDTNQWTCVETKQLGLQSVEKLATISKTQTGFKSETMVL